MEKAERVVCSISRNVLGGEHVLFVTGASFIAYRQQPRNGHVMLASHIESSTLDRISVRLVTPILILISRKNDLAVLTPIPI